MDAAWKQQNPRFTGISLLHRRALIEVPKSLYPLPRNLIAMLREHLMHATSTWSQMAKQLLTLGHKNRAYDITTSAKARIKTPTETVNRRHDINQQSNWQSPSPFALSQSVMQSPSFLRSPFLHADVNTSKRLYDAAEVLLDCLLSSWCHLWRFRRSVRRAKSEATTTNSDNRSRDFHYVIKLSRDGMPSSHVTSDFIYHRLINLDILK